MTLINSSHETDNYDKNRVVIPQRFSKMIDIHLLGNMLGLNHFPLIMAIIGKPGMGKTYQLRNYLKMVGFTVVSMSAADLESDHAGEPAKLLQQKYVFASNCISQNIPSVLLIDDIDTTLGEWENHTGTVNHQNILAFLMHVADNPTHIESEKSPINRVPIFFTGNNFERLYKPLVRTGRANRFDWEPNRDEKISIIESIFSLDDEGIAEAIVDLFPDKEISFYAFLMSQIQSENLAEIAQSVSYRWILENPNYKNRLFERYKSMGEEINLIKKIRELKNDVE